MLQGSTWYNLLRGALEVAGGLLAGILLGFIIQYFPSIDQVGAEPPPVPCTSAPSPQTENFMRDEQTDARLLRVFNGLYFSARNML